MTPPIRPDRAAAAPRRGRPLRADEHPAVPRLEVDTGAGILRPATDDEGALGVALVRPDGELFLPLSEVRAVSDALRTLAERLGAAA